MLDEVWSSSNADRGGRVNLTNAQKGALTPTFASKAKKTGNNYQVKFPGSRASTARHAGVTEPIFARGSEDMEHVVSMVLSLGQRSNSKTE